MLYFQIDRLFCWKRAEAVHFTIERVSRRRGVEVLLFVHARQLGWQRSVGVHFHLHRRVYWKRFDALIFQVLWTLRE